MCTRCTCVCTTTNAQPYCSRVSSRCALQCSSRLSSGCSIHPPGRVDQAQFPDSLCNACAALCVALLRFAKHYIDAFARAVARAWSPLAASCGAGDLSVALPAAALATSAYEGLGWCAGSPTTSSTQQLCSGQRWAAFLRCLLESHVGTCRAFALLISVWKVDAPGRPCTTMMGSRRCTAAITKASTWCPDLCMVRVSYLITCSPLPWTLTCCTSRPAQVSDARVHAGQHAQ